MPNYDFKSLSPWEFEQLSRDLLKAGIGMEFELFKTGRDQGIDLRYSKSKSNEVIAQCKHYANSSFSNLKANLKKDEIGKIIKLSPRRYLLITSLGMTPSNKKEIAEILGSYLWSFSDIVTRDTLNGWLGEHPNIERRHIKLWATTSAVLEQIIHSGIFNYTTTQIDLLEEKLSYYVKNQSFDLALEILGKQGFCIIAGMPGIGKTTLAEMLLIDYVKRGYEPIRITADIDEAFKTYNPTRRQAFYYDDFLGQTGLDNKLNKNEDQRIADFCRLCAKGKHSVFIMTTREYILNQAKSTYEKLERFGLDINKCVIDISSYAILDRAKILYNHLYFRGLPHEYITEVVKDKNYLRIVRHRSFNPRVIEWMTDYLSVTNTPATNYVDEFISRLDHPAMIWEHAYKYQISDVSKHLLLALLSMPNIVHLADCKKAFDGLRKQYCLAYGESRVHNEFNAALKECEGNFIRVDLAAGHQTVQFHNPSIRDYLTFFLSSEINLLRILIQSFENFDQPVSLWNSFEPLEINPLQSDNGLNQLLQQKIANTLGSKSVRLIRYSNHDGSSLYGYANYSTHDQVRFILTEELGTIVKELKQRTTEVLAELFSNLDSIYDWSDIASLLGAINDAPVEYELDVDQYLGKTLSVLPYNLNQVADYRYLAEICSDHNQAFTHLKKDFQEYGRCLKEGLDDELRYINSVDDIGTLEECADDIERISDVFNLDLSSSLSMVRELIEDLEYGHENEDETPVTRHVPHPIADDPELIESMFETLN
jgi:hypothetical protein